MIQQGNIINDVVMVISGTLSGNKQINLRCVSFISMKKTKQKLEGRDGANIEDTGHVLLYFFSKFTFCNLK